MNAIDRSCFNHAILDVNSCIGAKVVFSRTIGVDIFDQKICAAIKQVPQNINTFQQQVDIETCVDSDLMFVRSEQSFIEGVDHTEIDCIIQYK